MTKILYIAGYGRSGSTVLSVILGNHPDIVSAGELTYLLDDWNDPNRQCSCSKEYPECQYWRDLFQGQSPPAGLARSVRNIDRSTTLPVFARGRVENDESRAYREFGTRLFKYIESTTGKSIIVDSSKSARNSAGRFLALNRIAGQDVYVLHLVRDGLATMESLLLTGSNWAMEGHGGKPRWMILRAALGWVRANIWVSTLGTLLGRKRHMFVRYEDFIEAPAAVVGKVCRFLDIEAEALVERIDRNEVFEVGHLVGGNRVRLKERIELRRGTITRPHNRLKLNQRLIFGLLGSWLNRWYGYHGG